MGLWGRLIPWLGGARCCLASSPLSGSVLEGTLVSPRARGERRLLLLSLPTSVGLFSGERYEEIDGMTFSRSCTGQCLAHFIVSKRYSSSPAPISISAPTEIRHRHISLVRFFPPVLLSTPALRSVRRTRADGIRVHRLRDHTVHHAPFRRLVAQEKGGQPGVYRFLGRHALGYRQRTSSSSGNHLSLSLSPGCLSCLCGGAVWFCGRWEMGMDVGRR